MTRHKDSFRNGLVTSWLLDVNLDTALQVRYDTTLLINFCSKISLEIQSSR